MSWRWWWGVIAKRGPLLRVLCSFFYINHLNSSLKNSKQENSVLIEKLKTKDSTLLALKQNAERERETTIAQIEKERQLRGKADEDNKALREALKDSDCSNQPLPFDALNILRKEANE